VSIGGEARPSPVQEPRSLGLRALSRLLGWELDPDARRLYLLGVGQVKAKLHRALPGRPNRHRHAGGPALVGGGAMRPGTGHPAAGHRQAGAQRRRNTVQRVAVQHRKVVNCRRDLAHQVSRWLVDGFDVIVHEDLAIPNMVRRPSQRPNQEGTFDTNGASATAGLNRSISDAGWGQLLRFLAYKRRTLVVS